MKPKIAVMITDDLCGKVLNEKQRVRLESFSEVIHRPYEKGSREAAKAMLAQADGCITCWGSVCFDEEILAAAPHLKIIAHAAGSVKFLVTDALWERNIQVTSAAAANGISVAEHTLGLIITSLKRIHFHSGMVKQGNWRENNPEYGLTRGLYGIKIGIVGAGHIGRYITKLLHNFDVELMLYDPFVSREEANRMGVQKMDTLEELIRESDVLTIHAPNLPETRHMFNKDNLKYLKDGAILINTARGALIDETALYDEARDGRITVYLDVTDPEPPSPEHPLLKLPNVIITPHIAGALFNDIQRMGQYAVTEMENFFSGKPLLYPVRKDDLARMA